MCRLLGINKTRTTVYHPQSNGMVERLNRTLGKMMVAFAAEQPRTWDEQLSLLTMASRATPHESTRYSPNHLMFGREIMLPIDVMLGTTPDRRDEEETEYAMDLRDWLETAFAHVRQNAKTAAEEEEKQ